MTSLKLILKRKVYLKIYCKYPCVCMGCAAHGRAVDREAQKWAPDPLGLEFQEVVSHLIWALEQNPHLARAECS